jgi:DNA-binding transcriptional LysR family regulator
VQDSVYWTDLRNKTVLLSKHDPGRELEDLLVYKFLSAEERPTIERHDVSRAVVKSLTSMGLGVSLALESDIGTTLAGLAYRELLDGTGPSRIDFHAHWRGNNKNSALESFLKLLSKRYPSLATGN